MDTEKLAELEEKLKIKFKNKKLLYEALTHRSYLNEHPDWVTAHNERLEFLGDAVLELVVTEELFVRYKEKAEGELTALRSALVNSSMLARRAEFLDLNSFILLSRGESQSMGRARETISANTFEAIVGALYLDQGYEACRKFVERHVLIELSNVLESKLWRDPKSLFQEAAQDLLGITPTYKVLQEWGPDHNKHFIVGIFLGEEKVAEGEGPSKREAEVQAAKQAVQLKHWENY